MNYGRFLLSSDLFVEVVHIGQFVCTEFGFLNMSNIVFIRPFQTFRWQCKQIVTIRIAIIIIICSHSRELNARQCLAERLSST
jgi:hypothetical protein